MSDTLADGLIGYWRFNGNLEDSSGNNRTLVGTSSNFATDFNGNANSCMGANSYLGLDERLILETDNSPFSFSIWFEKNTDTSNQILIGNGTSGGGGCYVQKNGYGQLQAIVSGHGEITLMTASELPSINLITVKYDGVIFTVKVNNIVKFSSASSLSAPSESYKNFAVGCYTDRMGHAWKSRFDEARVYNRALTDEEETLIYQQGINYVTPPIFNSVIVDTITTNSCDLNVNVNEDGKVYYKVLARNATAPTSEELKANPTGQANVTANITSVIPISSLIPSTEYNCYVVAEGIAGNLQAESTKIQFQTTLSHLSGGIDLPNFMEGHIIEFKDITLNKTIEMLGEASDILPEKFGYQEFESIYGITTESYVAIKNQGNIVVTYISEEDYNTLYDAWRLQSRIYIKTELGKQYQGRIKDKRLGLKPSINKTNGNTYYTGNFNITT